MKKEIEIKNKRRRKYIEWLISSTGYSVPHIRGKVIRIPKQIALGGFGKFSAPELFSLTLTTVVQPSFDVGKSDGDALAVNLEQKAGKRIWNRCTTHRVKSKGIIKKEIIRIFLSQERLTFI